MEYFCQESPVYNYEEIIRQTQIETYYAKQLSWILNKCEYHKKKKTKAKNIGETVID